MISLTAKCVWVIYTYLTSVSIAGSNQGGVILDSLCGTVSRKMVLDRVGDN